MVDPRNHLQRASNNGTSRPIRSISLSALATASSSFHHSGNLNGDIVGHDNQNASSSPVLRLLPVPVLPYAPVRQDERQHYLKLLHHQYSLCNEKFENNTQAIDNNVRRGLVKISIQKELQMAKSCKTKMEYQHAIKKLMFNLKKFGTEDGLPKPIIENTQNIQPNINLSINANTNITHNPNHNHMLNANIPIGSEFEFDLVYKELQALCVPVKRLIRNGYVTEPVEVPEDHQLPIRVDCVRCGANFNLDDIENTVSCTYHPGKMQSSIYQNMDMGRKVYGTDYLNRFYGCCNEPKGQTAGCKVHDHHVYKFNDPKDLNLRKKFIHIKQLRENLKIDNDSKVQQMRKEKVKAVSLDCEMCFTNHGFEMMKLSLIDFKTEKKLIDSIIHPDGEFIIDLNTHVSGVESIPKSAMTFDEVMIKIAQLTDEDTIIVGHGLENDLNVLRLIYPKIVDTAILFSENQINSRRKDPLKKLAWKYLSENIQGKEHDSLEDAIIPARIVKKHIDKFLRIKQRNQMRR